jgi:hypothetical protein
MLVGIMANANPSALAYAHWTQEVFEAKCVEVTPTLEAHINR